MLLLSSCAVQYQQGLRPIYPKPEGTRLIDTGIVGVRSLQPTLVWTNEGSVGTKFDLTIRRGVDKPVTGLFGGPFPGDINYGQKYYVPGFEVYYRQNIEGFSHQVEQPLARNTRYVWAVRTRDGTNVGEWSSYSFQRQYGSGKNLWWSFVTP